MFKLSINLITSHLFLLICNLFVLVTLILRPLATYCMINTIAFMLEDFESFKTNETIGDGDITVDFRIIKVHMIQLIIE